MTEKKVIDDIKVTEDHLTKAIPKKEPKMMTIEEIASDPLLMEWLSKQPGFVEAYEHAQAVAAANPYIHQM